MNNITKGRLLSVVVVVLLLANIATLTTFWLKKENTKLPPPPQQQGGGGPFAFLVKELSFDSVQVIAYRKLRDEHQKDVEGYRKEMREAKDALFALLKEPSTNEGSLQNALNNIGEKEKNFDRIVFMHFQKVRALCTEVQQKKFDEVIQEALRMVPSGPQRQGPPPRREGDMGKDGPPPPGSEDNPGPPPPGKADGNRPPPPQDGNRLPQ